MASLYGPSYSGIYAKELKNIRAEQEASQLLIEQEKEEQKMIGGGAMQVGAYIGKGAKKFASTKLKEAARFDIGGGVMSEPIQKFETVAGKTPELFDRMGSFGDVGKTAWDTFEDYTGMSFGGESTQLTSEYITKSLESGSSIKELGIDISKESLFPDIVKHPTSGIAGPSATTYTPQAVGAETLIKTKEGIELGTAKLGEKGAITISGLSESGIKDAAAGSSTASAGSIAGTAAAGLGIAAGGYQMLTGEDNQTKIAGGLKAGGSALMLSGIGAPVGLAMTGLGTLLDFI
jgi:hypothetical protein